MISLWTFKTERNLLLQYSQRFKVIKVTHVGEKTNNYVLVSKPEGKA